MMRTPALGAKQPARSFRFVPAASAGNALLIATLITALLAGFRTTRATAQINLPSSAAFPPSEGPVRDLQRDLTDIFNDPNFTNSIWGVSIQSMETGETLFQMNEKKSLLPASNFKLFTAAEALSLLGPEFRYTTQLVTTGRISDGILRGDLIVRGSGDPTFGSETMFRDSSPTFVFEAWADSLRRLGVTRIDGSLVGDDTYMTEDVYPLGWAIEDEPYYYAMQTGGLSFDENQLTVSVAPGLGKGYAVSYELTPNTDYVTVDNRGTTKQDSIVMRLSSRRDTVIAAGSSSIEISREPATNVVTIRGQIPKSAPVTHESLSIENPTMYAVTVLREVLEEHGIQITGKTRSARDLAKPIPYLRARVLASYVSPPLSDVVAVMNKESDNLYAEQLFRTIGKEVGGTGNWTAGISVMKRFLSSLGMDTSRMAIYDGSGLSRMDLITAEQMSTLLKAMHDRNRLFGVFYPSLAIMGVDGTIAHRLQNTRAQGNVHAKTGFVTGVRSISGYLTTKDGELLSFAILGNNYTMPVSAANNLQDLVLLRLVNFSRK